MRDNLYKKQNIHLIILGVDELKQEFELSAIPFTRHRLCYMKRTKENWP